MSMIGNLLVRLGLNSAVFDRNMSRSRKHLGSFERASQSVSRSIRRMAGVLAAAFAARQITGWVSQSMAAIDRIAKLSDQLGIATEALSGYRLAAELSGTSIETVGKALQMLSRRLGEARMGTGEAKRGLELLNLEADELIDLPLQEAVERIADRIAQLTRQTDRAAAAYAFFGRQGQELLPMLQKGARHLREMLRESEELGLVFSRLDASQVEKANDAISRLKLALRGLMDRVVIEIAPVIEGLANSITAMLKKMGIKNIAGAIAEVFRQTISIILDVARQFFRAFGDLFRALGESTGIRLTIGNKFADQLIRIAESVRQSSRHFENLKIKIQGTTFAFEKLAEQDPAEIIFQDVKALAEAERKTNLLAKAKEQLQKQIEALEGKAQPTILQELLAKGVGPVEIMKAGIVKLWNRLQRMRALRELERQRTSLEAQLATPEGAVFGLRSPRQILAERFNIAAFQNDRRQTVEERQLTKLEQIKQEIRNLRNVLGFPE